MGVLKTDTPGAARVALPEPWRSALCLAVFVTMLAIAGPRHEPWFDEAQAWLIARDASLWDMLAHLVRYEGTPGLWHLILWLASHAGLPFSALWLISATLACVGAWIMLTRAPFPYWLRAGIVFSYFVAYQYAIVARSYALDLALLPALAATFAPRLQRPIRYGVLLGLTANANAHSFLIAGILATEFLFAIWRQVGWRAWTWPLPLFSGCAVYALFAIAAVLQAWPPADANYLSMFERESARGVQMLLEAFVDRVDIWNPTSPAEWSQRVGVVITVALLAPSVVLFQRAHIVLLAVVLFAVLIAFSIISFANAWHAGLLFLCWLLLLWIGWPAFTSLGATRRHVTLSAVGTIVFVNVLYTATAVLRDIREPYSAAPAAAEVVRGDDTRVAAAGFKTFAIQPWFASNIIRNYHNGEPFQAYYPWKRGEDFAPDVSFERWQEITADKRYNALVFSPHNIAPQDVTYFVVAALRSGYCAPMDVAGGLIWKSYVKESERLLVFQRCAADMATIGEEPPAP